MNITDKDIEKIYVNILIHNIYDYSRDTERETVIENISHMIEEPVDRIASIIKKKFGTNDLKINSEIYLGLARIGSSFDDKTNDYENQGILIALNTKEIKPKNVNNKEDLNLLSHWCLYEMKNGKFPSNSMEELLVGIWKSEYGQIELKEEMQNNKKDKKEKER